MYHGLGISQPSSSSLHGAESHWWLCPTAARRPWSLFACLLACLLTGSSRFLRALLQDHQKKAQIQRNESTQHCSSEVCNKTRDCWCRRRKKTVLDDCREAAAAAVFLLPARRAEPTLACLCSASDFYFYFFWRIIEFLAPDFYFSTRAGYHYKQCFLFSVL